jgi:hypothetical protein
MPSEEIRIVLDDRPGTYRPGESVSGHVEVAASAGEADGSAPVTVGLWWEARGAGDTDQGAVHEVEIAPGPGVGGGRYPFRIPAPSGPWSYDGSVFRVEWLLEARIGRRGPTSARLPIRLVPDPDRAEPPVAAAQIAPLSRIAARTAGKEGIAALDRALIEQATGKAEATARKVRPLAIGCGALVFLWFFGSPLILVFTADGEHVLAQRLTGLLCGGLPLVLGAAGWISMRRARTAREGLSLEVSSAPRLVAPGGEVTCTVSLTPRRPFELASAEVVLLAEEQSYWDTSDGHDTRRETLRRSATALAGARPLAQGERVTLTGRVPIPSDAPASFQSKHHMVTWELCVTVVPAGWPRLEERLKLVVHPTGRS